MEIKANALSNETIFERLQKKGFEYEEIEEAVKHLLLTEEKEFLNDLYPLGLDVSTTKYEFTLLNKPASSVFNDEYWELAQKILGAFGNELEKYYMDATGDVISVEGLSIPEERKQKLLPLLHLKQLYKLSEKPYLHFSSEFDYVRMQSRMKYDMCKIIDGKILSSLPVEESLFQDKRSSAKRLSIILSILESLMLECRKQKNVIRYHAKTGVKYLKQYNPKPFIAANSRARIREVQDSQIQRHLATNKALSISIQDLSLFRKAVFDSTFMTFIRNQSDQYQGEEGLDSYSLVRLWINPNDIKKFSDIAREGLHLETIGGTLKESVSLTIAKYQSTNLSKLVGPYKVHRPETIRYLGNKARNGYYTTSGFICSNRQLDRLFILLNVMTPEKFAQLPLLEQRFITLKFGLNGGFYPCDSIAKILNADLNLIRNYYAKYLKLILKAMEIYSHQYVDLEAEKGIVLK